MEPLLLPSLRTTVSPMMTPTYASAIRLVLLPNPLLAPLPRRAIVFLISLRRQREEKSVIMRKLGELIIVALRTDVLYDLDLP